MDRDQLNKMHKTDLHKTKGMGLVIYTILQRIGKNRFQSLLQTKKTANNKARLIF
jgi:hypothetical protein